LRVFAPTTPCARRRCAPRAAARPNALPHSGQVKAASVCADPALARAPDLLLLVRALGTACSSH
jgi:hypothetical protein